MTSATPAIGVAGLLGRPYKTIRLEWTSHLRMLRIRMCVLPVQCFSLSCLAELAQVREDINCNPGLVRHLVMTSDVPDVFNFGGDLSLFVLLVRAGDTESLKLYARQCIELVWWLENTANLGIHTTVLAQGDTLGGGLEAALPFHKVIFERKALGGFPEVMFNLFPGMGAWDFTIRKAGFAVASELVLSARMFTAMELFERGVVDVVAENGEGEKALEEVVNTVDLRLRGTLSALQAQRIAAPIKHETLLQIVDRWAECALGLTDRDLRLMERLARAQARKVGGADEGAVEEIKRLELEHAWKTLRPGATPATSVASPSARTP